MKFILFYLFIFYTCLSLEHDIARQKGKNPSNKCLLSSKLPHTRLTPTRHKGENLSDEDFEDCTLPRAQVPQAHHESKNPSNEESLN